MKLVAGKTMHLSFQQDYFRVAERANPRVNVLGPDCEVVLSADREFGQRARHG